MQGDWNAKIGPDAYEQWAGTVGRFGIGETNDRGLRLLEFASTHKLTLANTLHIHNLSRRTTWHSPNGTFPGADIGSDHDMVLATLELKLKKIHH